MKGRPTFSEEEWALMQENPYKEEFDEMGSPNEFSWKALVLGLVTFALLFLGMFYMSGVL